MYVHVSHPVELVGKRSCSVVNNTLAVTTEDNKCCVSIIIIICRNFSTKHWYIHIAHTRISVLNMLLVVWQCEQNHFMDI